MMLDDKQADYSLAQNTALKILDDHLINDPPVLPVNIVQYYGLLIAYIDFEDKYSDVAGFLDVKDKVIYINKLDTPDEQMFTIAHEFGHFLLHRNMVNFQKDEFPVFMRNTKIKLETDFVEQEANFFATTLLTPKKLLDKYRDKVSISELARLFMVSENFIRYRLRDE